MFRPVLLLACLLCVAIDGGCYNPKVAEGLPCADNGECPSGQVCEPFTMTCRSRGDDTCVGSEVSCGGQCFDLSNDPDHCGDCERACTSEQVCSEGECADTCAGDLVACDGSCVDLTSDVAHCGSCAQACDAATEECRGSSCERRCDSFLDTPVQDSWGAFWDGQVRTASEYADAEADCAAFGGRLPTATELYRVSATVTGDVGSDTATEKLWSLVPYDADNQMVGVLSTGALTAQKLSNGPQAYRCICPEPQPTTFSGAACYGTPGSECFALGRDGGHLRIDSVDRPPLRKFSALWECAFEGGHLASFGQLAAGIKAGLAGNDVWVHTADDVHYQNGGLVRWTGDAAAWVANGNLSWSAMNSARAFRCAGFNTKGSFGTVPATAFVGSRLQADSLDRPSASWVVAHDDCYAAGGHVPRMSELVELIFQGLPNGTNGWIFSSDEAGYNGTNFLVITPKWLAVDTRISYRYSGSMTWVYRTNSYPSRCAYYAHDLGYSGPAEADCAGGCVKVDMPSGASMWFDAADRASSKLEVAYETCQQVGGRLATKRDLHEAIRLGLLNGSGTNIWTDDIVLGNGSAIRQIITGWTGLDTGYTGQWTAYSTWATLDQSFPFRCMWTNELR